MRTKFNRHFLIRNFLFSLRIVGFLEGLSYIALMFVAMPLKYIFENPSWIYPIGMAHGALFVAFCIYLLIVGLLQQWKFKELLLGFISSLLPFGTFVFDRKILGDKIRQSQSVSR